MPSFIDITGLRFNRLTAQYRVPSAHRGTYWQCECDCGRLTVVNAGQLKNGKTKSCGCWRVETSGDKARVHGGRHTAEYATWGRIKERCYNPNNPRYKDYGGRGITICSEWKDDYVRFLADMGPRPSPEHSIDRRDNDLGYSKANCYWATHQEQNSNTRRNVLLTFNGVTLTTAEWARRTGMAHLTIRGRLHAGWTVEETLTTAPNTIYHHKKRIFTRNLNPRRKPL